MHPALLLFVLCSRYRSQCHPQTSWSMEPPQYYLIRHPISHHCKQTKAESRSLVQSHLHLEPLWHSYRTHQRCCTVIRHLTYLSANPDFRIPYGLPLLLAHCHKPSPGPQTHNVAHSDLVRNSSALSRSVLDISKPPLVCRPARAPVIQ